MLPNNGQSAPVRAVDAAPLVMSGWSPIGRLPPLLPPVPTLDPSMIPEAFRGWLTDAADRMQMPLECVAVPAIASLASVKGRKLAIRPKRVDDWTVVGNLWGVIVGRPSLLKSPAVREGMRPIEELVRAARLQHESEKLTADANIAELKAREAAIEAELREAAKAKTSTDTAKADLMAVRRALEEAGVSERRYITHDSTPEKLVPLLKDNPNGLLILRDELDGLLAEMNKPGREGARQFYISAWDGLTSYSVDRISRESLHIEALSLTVFGSTQPGKIGRYVSDAVNGGTFDDGLLQRFQMLVWPDVSNEWTNVDRRPDAAAYERARAVFQWVNGFDPATIGAETDGLPSLRFAPAAQMLFDQWRENLERRLRSAELQATPAFEAHLGKYRSLMPSLALIFHLIDVADGAGHGPVSLNAARLAAEWAEFLETHSRRVYAPEVGRAAQAAHALWDKIASGAIEDGTTIRDVCKREWSSLTSNDAVNAGLETLAGIGALRTETITPSQRGGRPSIVIRIHPGFPRAA